MRKGKVRFSVTTKTDVKKKLEKLAEKHGESLSTYAGLILQKHVESEG